MQHEIKTQYLQTGDVIFEKLAGRIIRKITISRITETQAISGNTKFDKAVYNGFVRVLGGRKTLPYRYLISTPELEKEWRKTVAIAAICKVPLDCYNVRTLEAMAALCG